MAYTKFKLKYLEDFLHDKHGCKKFLIILTLIKKLKSRPIYIITGFYSLWNNFVQQTVYNFIYVRTDEGTLIPTLSRYKIGTGRRDESYEITKFILFFIFS